MTLNLKGVKSRIVVEDFFYCCLDLLVDQTRLRQENSPGLRQFLWVVCGDITWNGGGLCQI